MDAKDSQALEEASAEMQRSKVGRRARITGTAEHVSRAAAVAQSPDTQPAEASRLPRKPHSWIPRMRGGAGGAGGFSPPSPKTSFYRPETLTISPGFLTVEGHFSPNISSESPFPHICLCNAL